VTTYPAADDAALDVRTFDALLWHERFTGHTPNRFATTARLLWTDNERFAEQLYRCTQRPPRNRDGNYQTFDGMSAAALCCWKGTVHTIRDVSGTRSPAFAKFLREFLRAVRGALPVGECRTAVSHAKRHL